MSVISDLQEITGCEELTELQKGSSTRKYRGFYKNKPVLVRHFVERQYYGNRYQREGFAIKHLEEHKNQINFEFPKIVLEIPEKSIRVVEWIEGKSMNEVVVPRQKQNELIIKLWESLSSLPKPEIRQFNLIRDLKLLTEDDSFIVSSAKSFYNKLRETVWNSFDKSIIKTHPKTLIHGDFFPQNIIIENASDLDNTKLGLIDWEYASVGSKFYDLSYIKAYGNVAIQHENSTEINSWTNLIYLLITHWYGTHYDVNPTESKEWLQNIRDKVF